MSLTSEAGPVEGIHGDHGLRDAGRTADSGLVQGSDPEDVRMALRQSCDGEAGVLRRDVVTLSPVVSAHLAPAQKDISVIKNVIKTVCDDVIGADYR